MNAGYNQIFVLTQFNTASLHRHIQESYKFDPFGGGFVDILSAEQTEKSDTWYQGLRMRFVKICTISESMEKMTLYYFICDQLFRMNLADFVKEHIENKADVSIAAKPLPLDQAEGLGLMRVNENLKLTNL